MRHPNRVVTAIAFASALGSATVGGVLFAFSSFVMPALASLPPRDGTAAMNAINVTVINPGFMLVFMGTAALCLGLAVCALIWWRQLAGRLLLAGSLVYLVGCIGVTAAFNVPLNDKLAASSASEAVAFWPGFLADWTAWNHVRSGAATLAAALLIWALIARGSASTD